MNSESHNDDLQSEAGENSTSQFDFQETANPYKETAYTPRKCLINFSRNSYILIGIIIIIIIFIISIIISTSVHGKDDANKDSNKDQNLLRSLVISSDNNLWIFNVDTNVHEILQTTNNNIIALDTYIDKSVFWRENNSFSVASLSNKYPIVKLSSKWNPQAIAIDYITEKLYLLDKPSGTLNVVDMKNNYFAVIFSYFQDPHDLVLDPAEGFVFIVHLSQAISRANMDGTSIRRIIEAASRISSIAIDRKATKIYWVVDGFSIESSDYDGNNRVIVTRIAMGVFSLSVFENQLFWTRARNSSDVCPCTNILWSCSMHRRNCKSIVSHNLSFDNPKIVRASFDQHRHLVKNPCEKNNGGCQHLCLMTSAESHVCACKTGWELSRNGKNCNNLTELLIYVQGSYVRMRTLDLSKETFTDAAVPTRINLESLTLSKSMSDFHFDYDMKNGDFFFNDDYNVYKMNLLKNDKQTKIFNVTQDFVIKNLAFDWYKGNMYYIKESQNPFKNHSVEMFNVNVPNKLQKIILTIEYKRKNYTQNKYSLLAIHPIHEYLFYTVFDGTSDNLRRIGTNGHGIIQILALYGAIYVQISIDVVKSRLYYVTSTNPHLIVSKSLDGGTASQEVRMKIMSKLTFLGVHANWMYVSNVMDIWRLNSETGNNATRAVQVRYNENLPVAIYGLRIIKLVWKNVN